MKCIAEKEIKNCCFQEYCCTECNYDDCREGCNEFDLKASGCNECEYSVETVIESTIARFNIIRTKGGNEVWK